MSRLRGPLQQPGGVLLLLNQSCNVSYIALDSWKLLDTNQDGLVSNSTTLRGAKHAHQMPYSVEQLESRSLADIAEELFKLREESSAMKEAQLASQVEQATALKELKETVERLERKNARLLDTNGQFAAILEERWRAKIQRRGVQAASIPYDILLHIFENTQIGLHECEHSVVPEPRSRWFAGLRMEKALTLVCKGWACPATKLLYADIVLRRMGQITALAHTLR
ncbi:hypothetical protein K466DRAFT_655029, partial [Polyporus arcularius HHB13444]